MLDPQARALIDLMASRGVPPVHTQTADEARRLYRERRAYTQPDPPAVGEVRDVDAGGVPARLYRPAAGRLPVLVYLHGGGWTIGDLDTHDVVCRELALAGGCAVLSVDYRLAPEHPCPAALDDVEAGFYYAIRNCAELNVDVNRIAVMGRDAGAALVAGLSQRMFDAEGPQILVQILHQPMLDSDATQSRREFQRTPGLNGPAVSRAWGHYLGHASASGQHVPAHRANLEGLPPTFISCAEIDPCRDEAIDYANRLLHAYVHTELHVIAAAFNGFDSLVPEWVVSRENRALHARSLRRVFAM
jgi:acetyl esterase/lipase